MKLQAFHIELWNNITVFYPGSPMAGRLIAVIAEGMKMRNIQVELVGEARVHWEETESTGSGDDQQTVTHDYYGHEVYANFIAHVYGSPHDHKQVLPPGRYELPFQFQIPPNCPTSFEGSLGSIRYYLRASIVRSGSENHVVDRFFTVIAMNDLNLNPAARVPAEASKEKTLGCACLKSGQISVIIRCPKTGYVCGETIQLFGEVNNNTSSQIKRIDIEFVQINTFTANQSGSSSKTDTRTVAKIQGDTKIEPHGSLEWKGEQAHSFLVPPLPANLVGCSIIGNHYELRIKVVPSGPHLNMDLKVPIILGTVPLQNFQPMAMPSAPTLPQPTANYADLPPPAYKDSYFGETDIDQSRDPGSSGGHASFTPQYAFYNMSN